MTDEQRQRVTRVINGIQVALDRGVEHFDCAGRRLKTVSAIIEAWARGGGLVVKEPERSDLITRVKE